MKKQILLSLVTLLTVTSAFAESEISRLQRVVTKDCSTQELQRAITATADNVLFEEKKVTVLEESLNITTAQKESGIEAKVLGSFPRSSVLSHKKSIAKAQAAVAQGQVGVTTPALFDVVYAVQDKEAGLIGNKGRVSISVTCRIEKKADGSIGHAASLLSFDVKAKGVK